MKKFLLLFLIFLGLTILSWIFPDPIPFIDEILLPIIDIWLFYKTSKE
jgi:polyferredoxin